MLDYRRLKNLESQSVAHAYTQRDTMLYALGLGFGAEPLDPQQLAFVYEKNLRAVPSMVAVLGGVDLRWRDPALGIDPLRIVHGEEHIELFRRLPVAASLTASGRIVALTDKGANKGALMVMERTLYERGNPAPLANVRQTLFLRGNGGFSAASGISDPAPAALPVVPDTPADHALELRSLPQQALIYRLNGDNNPLHVDPEVARAAGFPRPILHGLCTFGMATHAVLKACCDYDDTRIRSLAVRFTAPVYPGEAIQFEFWRAAPGQLRLRARVAARDAIVLDRGVIELRES